MSTMKAAQVVEFHKPYELREVPIPDPGDDLLLIQIRAASLCHSDLQVRDGEYTPTLPITGSHEACGVVSKIGRKVSQSGFDFKVGDRVGIAGGFGTCREGSEEMCEECKKGRDNYCSNPRKGFIGIWNGKGTMIPSGDGGFAEYALSDPLWTVHLPENLAFTQAAPLMCAGATVYQAFMEAKLKRGDVVALVGVGGLGLLGVQIGKSLGYTVVAIDTRREPLDALKTFSRDLRPDFSIDTLTLPGHSVLNELIHAFPDPARPSQTCISAALVLTDNLAAFDTAMNVVGQFGTVVAVGIPEEKIRVGVRDLVYKGVRVVGSLHSTMSNIRDMIKLCASNRITLPIETFNLEQIDEVVKRYESGKVVGRLCVSFTP